MQQLLTTLLLLYLHTTLTAQSDAGNTAKNKSMPPYGNHALAGRYYAIRGFKMYAETYGSGKPLLLIHGNGGSIASMANQIPYFAKKYKVIVADSRAQGKSIDLGDSLSYAMMADDYAALLDAMKIDSAFVVGWSDGGINTLLLAIRHPEKVSKLAVTGANLWPDSTAVYNDVINLVMPNYTALKAMTTKTPRQKADWKLTRLLIEEPQIALADLHKIAVPALVIGGDHDVIKVEHTVLIAQHIQQANLWILPNSGHSTPVVYKEEFNKQADLFFSKPYRVIAGGKRFY